MPFTVQQLKNELANDPTGLGYSGQPDNVCTGIINLARVGISIRRADISPGEVLEAIDTRDFTSSNTASENSWFESLTQLTRIRLSLDDGSDTVVLGNLKRLLQNPGPQGSRARVIALSNRQGSRAEQLWGAGTLITDADIGAARNLP
jgi:hypothetical protein